jgi:hypothetical protein
MLCHFAKLLGRGCMWTVGGSVLVARGRAGTRGTVACGGGGGSWSRLAQLAQSLVHHPRCVCVYIYIYKRSFITDHLVETDGPTACGTVQRYNLPRMITCMGLLLCMALP